jgi:hypothetical protein
MTWNDTIRTIDGSNFVTAGSFDSLLYGHNRSYKTGRTATLSTSRNYSSASTLFDKTSDSEIPYTVEWGRNSGPYYLMTSSVTFDSNNNIVTSIARVGLEYDVVVFSYTNYNFDQDESQISRTFFLRNERRNEEVSMTGIFTNYYGPKTTMKFVDWDTITFLGTSESEFANEVRVDVGYLAYSNDVSSFQYITTVAAEAIGGEKENFTTPPINGEDHFNGIRSRAAIRLYFYVE